MKVFKNNVSLLFVAWIIGALQAATVIEKHEGDFLTLKCPDQATDWRHLSVGKTPDLIISYVSDKFVCLGTFASATGACRNGINIDEKQGSFLSITSISMEDAGLYSCISNSTNCQMDVVVIKGSDPKFIVVPTTNYVASLQGYEVIPNKMLTFQCILTFSGFTSPAYQLVMRSRTGSEQTLMSDPRTTGSDYSSNIGRAIAAQYWASENDRNFGVYCQSSSSSSDYTRFQNIYGPVFIQPVDETLTLNNMMVTLNCSSDSYPPATYSWYQLNDFGRIGSLGFVSDTYKVDKAGQYACDAFNSRLGRRVTKSFKVKATTSFLSGSDLYLAGILVPIVLVMVPVWLILRCWRRYRESMVMVRFRQQRQRTDDRRREPELESPVQIHNIQPTNAANPPNDIWVMGTPPPMYDAPPSYDEATKTPATVAPSTHDVSNNARPT